MLWCKFTKKCWNRRMAAQAVSASSGYFSLSTRSIFSTIALGAIAAMHA